MKNRWSATDRRAFADGNRLRAAAIPGRRRSGPTIDEWFDDDGPIEFEPVTHGVLHWN